MKSKPETTALVSVNEYSFLKQEVKGTVEASQFKWRFTWSFGKGSLHVNPPLGRALIEDALLRFLLKKDYEIAVSARKRTTVGASEMQISEFTNYISEFVRGNIPPSPRKGIGAIPQLKLVVEDLLAFYTETITYRDKVDDFEYLGTWFWEKTKAGRLILCLEAVSLESDNKILKQIVDMSLITPRFWSEGPLPGTSGSGW